ncbi:hypothetical protein [Flavobacterium hercynium]|uniref:Uncharacterized protein n=1 Tax=Flavobacterium hercynium TaxID=387094 RepID=A0A226GPH9_9FLAO|nr:hypothetical protein [Flavobacterium hercynium]OXA83428.1 hypothetical protein B0A66_22280 [Flavobacterium hercynium]
MKNPDHICKDCGSFDLAKLSFNENVDSLISKTKVWKTAIVNASNEEKKIENLLKSDTIKLYKYHFSNQQNKILGKRPFNYNNQFFFDGLVILTDKKNKIYAYEATNFYDGKMSEIIDFVSYLKKENKTAEFKQNKMLGDLSVYQWHSENKILQLVKANEEGSEERIISGVTSVRKSTYVKLNIYDQSFMKNSIERLVQKDINFVIFNEKHYQNF